MKNKEFINWKNKIIKSKNRDYTFDTVSGVKNDVLYSPENLDDKYFKDLNFPSLLWAPSQKGCFSDKPHAQQK